MSDLAQRPDAPGSRGRTRVKARVGQALKQALRPLVGRHLAVFHALNDRMAAAERADQDLRERLEHQRGQLDHLARLQADQAETSQLGLAFGWDYVALVRRLATLEDRVEALTALFEAAEHAEGASWPFPAAAGEEAERLRSRVG